MTDEKFAATDDGDCGCEISLGEARSAAIRLGGDHGRAAASWVFDGNTDEDYYRTVLRWIDEGDPRQDEIEPKFGSAREVCDEIDIDYDLTDTADVDKIHDSYLDEARPTFWDEVERTRPRASGLIAGYRARDTGRGGERSTGGTMTAQFDLHDPQPRFTVDRNEYGTVILKISTDDGTVNVHVGGSEEDAENLRDELTQSAASLTENILAGWEDVPEEWDGYISWEERRGWMVSLSGKTVGNSQYGFPTLEIAMFELANAMCVAGEFSNAWVQGEHGPTTRCITSELRALQDEGGTAMRPLAGVQYDEGDLIEEAGSPTWQMTVNSDYGELGITVYAPGDPDVGGYIKHTGRARWHLVPRTPDGRLLHRP